MQKTNVVAIDSNGIAAALGNPIVDNLVANQTVTEHSEIVAKDGRVYRAANIVRSNRRETLQLVRAVPKVKGKAARKAEKRARHLALNIKRADEAEAEYLEREGVFV